MFLMCRITESKRQQNELNKQKITERELSTLNQKINKLLTKLEEHDQEVATSIEEECVICITSKATISTYPCQHTVICRRCFVKTIQNSVQQKHLPLRCVICREKFLRLKQTFTSLPDSNRKYKRTQSYSKVKKQEYSSSYSMSSSSKSTCKKRIAQQTPINQINDQKNAIENKKAGHEKPENPNNLTPSSASQETEKCRDTLTIESEVEECSQVKSVESQTATVEVNCPNGEEFKFENSNGTNASPSRLESNLERIEKLKKLTNERSLSNRTLKNKILNYFTVRVQDNVAKRSCSNEEEKINYSVAKKMKNTWFTRIKNKLNNYSNGVKVLFNF